MELRGKTAFITGAASGIGLAMARKCAAEGMKLILTDIEVPALQRVAEQFAAAGVDVSHYVLDVSCRPAYEAVAKTVLKEHGAPYMLFNNAGVAWDGPVSTSPIGNWEWMIGVNVMGVCYGLSLFVPAMIASSEKGYVINTGSISGLATPAGGVGIYGTTKHAIVALSEALMHDLRPHGMHAVVICPGSVATNIAAADRNQPQGKPADDISSPDAMTREVTRLIVSQGLSPAAVADQTFAALEERRFYVITHPEYKHVVEMRHRQIEGAMTGEPATDVEFIKMQEAAAAAAQMEPLT